MKKFNKQQLNKFLFQIKEQIIIWLPAITLYLYSYFSFPEVNFIIRLIIAGSLQMLALFTYAFIIKAIEYIFLEEEIEFNFHKTKNISLTATLILAITVFIWQTNTSNQKIENIKNCIDENQYELRRFNKLSDSIGFCNETLNDQIADYYESRELSHPF